MQASEAFYAEPSVAERGQFSVRPAGKMTARARAAARRLLPGARLPVDRYLSS